MEFEQVITLINQHYPEVLSERGEVFFGSRQSLRNSNGISLIGLNPGGDGLSSIEENLSLYSKDPSKETFSGYLDQCWHEPYFSNYQTCERCKTSIGSSGIVHQDKHQKMVSKIANQLQFDLRKTIALNAIWMQSRNTIELKQLLKRNKQPNMDSLFQSKIFPIISEIFRVCKIRLVICLGNGASASSFEFFRNAYNVPEANLINASSNYRDGKMFVARTPFDGNLFFFGIPHPSMHQLTELGMQQLKLFKEQAFADETSANRQ